jgi:hypothetical protein
MATGEFEDQIREMIAALAAKRDQASKPFDDAIRGLETVLRTIPPAIPGVLYTGLHTERPKESSAARTRRIITSLLKEANGSMSISEIAHKADDLGVLVSKRGYKGVYADIARVLIRNQHLFAKAHERGFWKLKEAGPPVSVRLVSTPMVVGPAKTGLGGSELGRASALAKENREKERIQS